MQGLFVHIRSINSMKNLSTVLHVWVREGKTNIFERNDEETKDEWIWELMRYTTVNAFPPIVTRTLYCQYSNGVNVLCGNFNHFGDFFMVRLMFTRVQLYFSTDSSLSEHLDLLRLLLLHLNKQNNIALATVWSPVTVYMLWWFSMWLYPSKFGFVRISVGQGWGRGWGWGGGTGMALDPAGSSWPECVRGIMGSNILPHI